MQDEYTRLKTGDDIPEFSVTTLDGQKLDTSTTPDRMVLMHFFILSCPWCRDSIEHLGVLQENLKGTDKIFLISVGRGHSAEELGSYRDINKIKLSLAPDPDRSIYNRFAERKVPRCYLFSSKGKLLFQVRGSEETAFHELLQILNRELASG